MSPGPPICTHNPMQIAVRDYAIALKLFVHYLDPKVPNELELFIKLLEGMPDNTAVLGWFEEDEHITVHLASIYNKFVVVMTHHYGPLSVPNVTVWSGLRVENKFKLPPIRFDKLGGRKVYLTFYITDGDNTQWDYGLIRLWNDPNRGKVPIAWTISPFLVDIAPLILDYYASTSSDNDTFISGPSGAGYYYPISNPDYVDKFLEVSKRYFELSGLNTTEILGYSDSTAVKYIEKLKLLAIKKGYSEYPKEYFEIVGQGAYYLDKNTTPIIFAVLHYRDKEVDKFLKSVEKIKAKSMEVNYPLLVLVVSQPWDLKDLSKLAEIVEKLSKDSEISIVNFHEFCTLLNLNYGAQILERNLEEIAKKIPKEVEEIKGKIDELRKLVSNRKWKEAIGLLNELFNRVRKLNVK